MCFLPLADYDYFCPSNPRLHSPPPPLDLHLLTCDADDLPEVTCALLSRSASQSRLFSTSLCTRTYMRCLGIVATYLVILLQLRPQNQTGAEDERDLGIIQCFNSIKPFGRRIQCRVADPPSHM